MGKSFFDIYEPKVETPKTVVQTITNITVPKEEHQEPSPIEDVEDKESEE